MYEMEAGNKVLDGGSGWILKYYDCECPKDKTVIHLPNAYHIFESNGKSIASDPNYPYNDMHIWIALESLVPMN